MSTEVTQRELRNNSGAIMRGLDQGKTYVVTRNGFPEAARAYGRIFSAVTASGRKARDARAVDLLIAATACADDLPLFTRNGEDFRSLEGILDVYEI